MDIVATDTAEPVEWFVVFHRKAASRLFSMLAAGEFKHVSAIGYCPGFKVWLLYDVQWSGTRLRVISHDAAKKAVAEWSGDCDIVKISRRSHNPRFLRLGFTCVSAVKHLLSLRCVAMRPDALYRHIIRNGGTPIHDAKRPATAAG